MKNLSIDLKFIHSLLTILFLFVITMSTSFAQRTNEQNQKNQGPPLETVGVIPKCEEGNVILDVTFNTGSTGGFCAYHAASDIPYLFVINLGANIVEIIPSLINCPTTKIITNNLKCGKGYSLKVYEDKNGDGIINEGEGGWNTFNFTLPVLIPCCSTPNKGCCPERENIMQYSNFELLSNLTLGGVPNDYDKETDFYSGSLSPGEYGFLNSNEANTICENWNITDHTTCDNGGKFLVINGDTGQSGSKKVWSGNVIVQKNKKYKFCAYFKALSPSCDSEDAIIPKIDIKFGNNPSEFDVFNQTVDSDLFDACNWMEITKTIHFNTTKVIKISIFMNETQIGDGNDLAIDDISLQEIPKIPTQFAKFGLSFPNDLGDGFYNLQASAQPLPDSFSNCGYVWEIAKLDEENQVIPETRIYNPSQWWPLASYSTDINFPGYNTNTNTLEPFDIESSSPAGVFKYTDSYRITRGLWCDCYTWKQASLIISPSNETGKIEVIQTDILGEYPRLMSQSISNNKEIELYPNPTSGIININTNLQEGTSYSILNAAGVILDSGIITSEYSIDIKNLLNGVYFVVLRGKKNEVLSVQKVVKE